MTTATMKRNRKEEITIGDPFDWDCYSSEEENDYVLDSVVYQELKVQKIEILLKSSDTKNDTCIFVSKFCNGDLFERLLLPFLDYTSTKSIALTCKSFSVLIKRLLEKNLKKPIFPNYIDYPNSFHSICKYSHYLHMAYVCIFQRQFKLSDWWFKNTTKERKKMLENGQTENTSYSIMAKEIIERKFKNQGMGWDTYLWHSELFKNDFKYIDDIDIESEPKSPEQQRDFPDPYHAVPIDLKCIEIISLPVGTDEVNFQKEILFSLLGHCAHISEKKILVYFTKSGNIQLFIEFCKNMIFQDYHIETIAIPLYDVAIKSKQFDMIEHIYNVSLAALPFFVYQYFIETGNVEYFKKMDKIYPITLPSTVSRFIKGFQEENLDYPLMIGCLFELEDKLLKSLKGLFF